MVADAPHHRSPNAGWPEAAMAAALGVALAGPRRYAGIIVSDPFINASGRRDANPTDIRRALRSTSSPMRPSSRWWRASPSCWSGSSPAIVSVMATYSECGRRSQGDLRLLAGLEDERLAGGDQHHIGGDRGDALVEQPSASA